MVYTVLSENMDAKDRKAFEDSITEADEGDGTGTDAQLARRLFAAQYGG